MKKKTLSLLATVLFVLIGSNMALALTLDNNVARFVTDDYGQVTEARYYLNGVLSGNLLDSSPTGKAGFTFGVGYKNADGVDYASSSLWLDEVISGSSSVGSNWYRFTGTEGVSYTGGTQQLSFQYDVRLANGKDYLDVRSQVSASGADFSSVRLYFYMEPTNGAELSAPTVNSGQGWQMVDDTADTFEPTNAAKDWLSSGQVQMGGGYLGIRYQQDGYWGASANDVWSRIDVGKNNFSEINSGVVSPTPSDPAFGINVPDGISNTWNLTAGNSITVQSRMGVNPEPATMGLMLTGLVGLAGMARRKFFLG